MKKLAGILMALLLSVSVSTYAAQTESQAVSREEGSPITMTISEKTHPKAKVTAGRDQLGTFAPKFAQLNDDVLFGEVWSREDKLSVRDRSIVTVTALMASGVLDSSLKFHIANAKKHGVTGEEMAEILTHVAFYAGWPKAWAAFRMAKEVYEE